MSVDRSEAKIREIRERPNEWLYHYTTLETALVHVLPRRRLRLSPFSRMRDPREYKQWFPDASGFFKEMSEAELARAMREASARLNLLRSEFKLLSLTEDSPDPTEGVYGRGFARSRLWESYAGRGSGVCLVLTKQVALESLSAQLKALGTTADKPVRYENGPIHAEIMFQFDEIFGDLDVLAGRMANRHLDRLFLTKNTEWESEHEYRFVVRSANEYEYVDISAALMAVVRGPESHPDAEYSLSHFARHLDIGLGQLRWDNNEPVLIGRAITR